MLVNLCWWVLYFVCSLYCVARRRTTSAPGRAQASERLAKNCWTWLHRTAWLLAQPEQRSQKRDCLNHTSSSWRDTCLSRTEACSHLTRSERCCVPRLLSSAIFRRQSRSWLSWLPMSSGRNAAWTRLREVPERMWHSANVMVSKIFVSLQKFYKPLCNITKHWRQFHTRL